MNIVDRIILQNKAWAQEQSTNDPSYFKHLAAGQQPKILWIGCSDSRVPAEEITGTGPGEIFVHRNIANVARADDFNLMSVLEYSVGVLGVGSVIVCGHRGCGGVKAAIGGKTTGVLDDWLEPIKAIHAASKSALEAFANDEARENEVIDRCVRAHVETLASIPVIKKAWSERQGPTLHGLVYGLGDGLLNEICRVEPSRPQ
ncbi:MAG: carbonic anhydrase [Clostridia bacterium]|nr:carbonic anhydrase [Deltaproteobacteria bacterium]